MIKNFRISVKKICVIELLFILAQCSGVGNIVEVYFESSLCGFFGLEVFGYGVGSEKGV